MRIIYRLILAIVAPLRKGTLMILRRLFCLASRHKVSWEKLCPLIAGLYYTIKATFAYEHRSMLYGQMFHSADLDTHIFTLRRNIHRLEKGLIMRPRRLVYAEDYILETTHVFKKLVGNEANHESELCSWAKDVMGEYFSVVEDTDTIAQARSVYAKICRADSERSNQRMIPQKAGEKNSPVCLDDLLKLVRQRKSVRWFLPDSVHRDCIDAAINVARHAPSACNRQPFQFRVIDKPDLLKDIVSLPMGTGGFASNIPCLVVVIGNLGAFPEERDRHIIYIDASLSTMLFQLALETQGIGSCALNWPEIDWKEAQCTKLLALDKGQRPVMLLAVGYPDPEGLVPYSQKKSVDQLRSFGLVLSDSCGRK